MELLAQHLHGSWTLLEVKGMVYSKGKEINKLVHSNSRFPDFRLLSREEAMFYDGHNWYEWEYNSVERRVFRRLVDDCPSHEELVKELEALIVIAGY